MKQIIMSDKKGMVEPRCYPLHPTRIMRDLSPWGSGDENRPSVTTDDCKMQRKWGPSTDQAVFRVRLVLNP